MSMISDKVVFLDIDGCLCTYRSHAAHGRGSLMLEWDRTGAALIKKACKITGAKLVISSTWRHNVHHKDLFPALKKHKLMELLYCDPKSGEDWRTENLRDRSEEILKWLDYHKVEKFVIVDDCDEGFSSKINLKPNFIQPKFENGLTFEHFCEIVSILGEK
jgi:HAD domain in Swiss Army Knife RNA repair proteins